MKRILLIPDYPGWAFDHRAKDIISLNLRNIKFDLKYREEINFNTLNKYDLIYPMSTSLAQWLYNKGVPLDRMAAAITSVRVYKKYLTKEKKN